MNLPIEQIVPEILGHLEYGNRLVIQAEPGAGKTTVAPLRLLDQDWCRGRIIVLEPRRLAAIAPARWMAESISEAVGETVGYRVRLDSRVSARTRIEMVTSGVFVRMIQDDPELAGVDAVVFDEFHERSIEQDLGLALALDAQENLRPDLRLILMSATIDGALFASKLACPLVKSAGRAHPVEIRWSPPRGGERVVEHTVRAVREQLHATAGSILVFLPGVGEINQAAERLRSSALPANVQVFPLHGGLPRERQEAAIAPPTGGQRKLVLATNIAETSLTIDGVSVVVDSGLRREPQYRPGDGMTRLVTAPISKAAAAQRAGRAGRVGPGTAVRMWSEKSHPGRAAFAPPEILAADLSPFMLELALWGENDPSRLFFIDLPPQSSVDEASALLAKLGALDGDGKITPLGREIANFGAHPRLAKMIVASAKMGGGGLARDLAAVLSERDFMRPADRLGQCDIHLRLEQLKRVRAGLPPAAPGFDIDRHAIGRILELANSWRRGKSGDTRHPPSPGLLLALAFPDRVGMRRPGRACQYLLSGGGGAALSESDPLSKAEFIVACACSGREGDAKVFLAAELERGELEYLFAADFTTGRELFWHDQEERVVARETIKLGELTLSEKRLERVAPDEMAAAVIAGLRSLGLAALPWEGEATRLRQRLEFLHRHFPDKWPATDEQTLAATLEEWLAPFLQGTSRRDQFGKIDLPAALKSQLDWRQLQDLDRLAPERIATPEGSRVRIDYSSNPPALPVKLQMMFGATSTPKIADGAVPLIVHLLSPAGAPLQVTSDLDGFWDGSYQMVKKEMKGRYPKHPWPDNPRQAIPTAKTKKALAKSTSG